MNMTDLEYRFDEYIPSDKDRSQLIVKRSILACLSCVSQPAGRSISVQDHDRFSEHAPFLIRPSSPTMEGKHENCPLLSLSNFPLFNEFNHYWSSICNLTMTLRGKLITSVATLITPKFTLHAHASHYYPTRFSKVRVDGSPYWLSRRIEVNTPRKFLVPNITLF